MDVKNIFQKICDELGGGYRMFFCNSPTPLQSEAFNLALATPKVNKLCEIIFNFTYFACKKGKISV